MFFMPSHIERAKQLFGEAYESEDGCCVVPMTHGGGIKSHIDQCIVSSPWFEFDGTIGAGYKYVFTQYAYEKWNQIQKFLEDE